MLPKPEIYEVCSKGVDEAISDFNKIRDSAAFIDASVSLFIWKLRWCTYIFHSHPIEQLNRNLDKRDPSEKNSKRRSILREKQENH